MNPVANDGMLMSDGSRPPPRLVDQSQRQGVRVENDEEEAAASSSSSNCCSCGKKDNNNGHHREVLLLPAETEEMIIKSLKKMTVVERQEALEDLHGVRDATQETPQMIRDKGKELDWSLDYYRGTTDRSAYDMAVFLRPSFVQALKVAFLRCENFDTSAAAARLIAHFAVKSDLWGVERLVRDIVYDDLSKDDLENLYSGVHFYFKDNVGRMVCLTFPQESVFRVRENYFRAIWYCQSHLHRSEDVQRKGLVFVLYMGTKGKGTTFWDPSRSVADNIQRNSGTTVVMEALPTRVTALHFCFDNPALKWAASVMNAIIKDKGRARFRAHFGSLTECQYNLQTFGISASSWPLKYDDDMEMGISVVFDQLYTFVQACRRQEAQDLEQFKHFWTDTQQASHMLSLVVYAPRPQDILLGKGQSYNQYSGNRSLWKLVGDKFAAYEAAASAKDKGVIIDQVTYKLLEENGARFLKRIPIENEESSSLLLLDGWIAESSERGREKVSQSFRNYRQISRRKQRGVKRPASDSHGRIYYIDRKKK